MAKAQDESSSQTGVITRQTLLNALDGVSPKRGKAFAEIGVANAGQLLDYFPRAYLYESEEKHINALLPDQVQVVRGEVVAVDYVSTRPRPRFEATIADGSDRLALVFFNGAYLRGKIRPGLIIRVKGAVKVFRNIPQMANPKWEVVAEETERVEESRFRPIYPATADLSTDTIHKIISNNLEAMMPLVHEWFGEDLIKRRSLYSRVDAYRAIHCPKDENQARNARRRLVYDEFMLMQLGLAIGKKMREGRLTAPVLRIDKLLDQRIRKRFPFELTEAQQGAIYEILKDVQAALPMNRLLQGDVGSGKTVVALYAMLVAVANKMQSALLAPTEVLAEQHFLTIQNMLRDTGVRIELFTGRTKRGAKNQLLADLAAGRIHLAIGTQALVQDDIEFANLGLVVVDEQHRLGVNQRAALKSKGLAPHYLVMTATPIPRTLALSYFADFDLSTINHLPPGRQPIKTEWYRSSQAMVAYDFIRTQIKVGRQAYIVVPKVSDDDKSELKSVQAEHDRLSKGALSGLKLGMLHGQMPAEDKQSIMMQFRNQQIDVLIATTVIEVGIDVPNANVILIDNADRFGLSQLHQLRGRVGRGKEQSHCILLSDAPTESSQERLRAMTETVSGFDIAELDLQLRGPGEFFGTRQHGLPEFKLADMTQELDLLRKAREDALELLAYDPKLLKPEHQYLVKALVEKFGDTILLAQVG